MSINHDWRHDLVAEMEQGIADINKYTWLDLAQEVIRLREELIDWANDEARAHNSLVKRAQEAGGAGIISTHKTIYNRIWEILGVTNE